MNPRRDAELLPGSRVGPAKECSWDVNGTVMSFADDKYTVRWDDGVVGFHERHYLVWLRAREIGSSL